MRCTISIETECNSHECVDLTLISQIKMVRYANLALISNKIIKTVTHEHKCTTQYQYETINTEVQAAATRTSHAPAIDNNI